jgi:hypothetical protein
MITFTFRYNQYHTRIVMRFAENECEEHERRLSYNFLNFLAESCGLSAVFLGVSILSLYDIVFKLVSGIIERRKSQIFIVDKRWTGP